MWFGVRWWRVQWAYVSGCLLSFRAGVALRSVEGTLEVVSASGRHTTPEPTPQIIETHAMRPWSDHEIEVITSHLSHASQIPRTEGACMLTLIIPSQTYPVLTAFARRKHDRIGQSTISTISSASEPLKRRIRLSSSRNGPPKLLRVATTTPTFVKDNGRACSTADYPPWYLWTSSIWPATMAASKRPGEDWDCRSQRRSKCTQRDRSRDERLRAAAGRG